MAIQRRSPNVGAYRANQLYVNSELVGGSDIVEQMYQAGELETLLNSIDASD